MAFVPVPDGVKVAARLTNYDQEVINTFWYTNGASWGLDEMEDLAEALWSIWADFVEDFYGAGCQLEDITVTDMRTQFAQQYVTSHSPVVGTVGSVGIPANAAIAVARRSGLTGRSTRGRIFLLVQNIGNVTEANEITSTFNAAALALVNALSAAAGAVSWTEVIASFVQNGVALSTAVTYTVVSYAIVNQAIDSMKRRLQGRGA